jgi:L-2-hydroxyglutarate oxidase LhgO
MADIDVLVVGAGVVGLAIARRLALAGLTTVIADCEDMIGTGTSSRNSEVIHAGLHYDGLPLKAALCVAGRRQLYRFCAEHDVPHRRCGKLITAFSPAEVPTLMRIAAAGERADVDDLELLSGEEAAQLEPAIACEAALLSPSTGIIDSHAFMIALLADAEAAGAVFARRTRVDRLTRTMAGDWAIHLAGESGAAATARMVVNAAGHGAHAIAMRTEGLPSECVPQPHYARGVYYVYQGAAPFTRLIYPVPVPGGLGTHLTLDMSGSARFGPDVEWIDTLDYAVAQDRRDAFASAARRIWPTLDAKRLVPGYCGVRPKISGPGEPNADFMIAGPRDHGVDRMVLLMGIESPGLTASLAIADRVATDLGVGRAPRV